jgi:hypothetical protein
MAENIDDMNVPTWRVEADAEITRTLVKKSARGFVWRQLGVGYLIAVGILLLCLLCLIAIRDYGWLTGALGVIVGLCLIFPISMWRNLESERLSRLGQMEKPLVHFVFDEKGLSADSDLGSSSLTWKTVTGVWEFPELWFLFMGKQHLIVPAAALSEELKQFIRAKVAENRNKTGAV